MVTVLNYVYGCVLYVGVIYIVVVVDCFVCVVDGGC